MKAIVKKNSDKLKKKELNLTLHLNKLEKGKLSPKLSKGNRLEQKKNELEKYKNRKNWKN